MSKSRADKATAATMEERITLVQMALLEGKTRKDILVFCDEWGICERQVDQCIARATEGIKELNKLDQEDNLAIVHTNLWDLFRKAKKFGDMKEAHALLNSIAKLKGLHEVRITKTIISKFDGVPDDEFDDILERELDESH